METKLQSLKEYFSHAFYVSDGRDELTNEDHLLLKKITQFVIKRGLTTPAIMLLETFGPLNFVSSSVMSFFKPTLGTLLKRYEYDRLMVILEKRCVATLLVEMIESELKSNQRVIKSKKEKSRHE